ncbi:FHA domain-containing protein [Kibdelosporangium philippinense]|uniref:FHA domain-containing protein n=1 Tax=Kibdelosporangium philippinense TaxID=211113 RepID=A0ABS8ZRL8_9PSEU|nr:FHA domain-containing protein [Kibdelosporangium philippinense]MCE7009595.1 FHA domain-containing protein [Kibdelosporangium philippinense]
MSTTCEHSWGEDGFCEICGLAEASPAPAVAPPEPAQTRECPSCGAPLDDRFCEDCGADSLATPQSPAPEPVANGGVRTWSVVVSADRKYYESVKADGGPDADSIMFPPYCPDRHFELRGEQVSIGRRSATRGIQPDIDLTGPPEDPGVSRLHALLVAEADGGWAIVDINSANGTTLNYRRDMLKPNTPRTLTDGDRVHIGAWTTITLHAD